MAWWANFELAAAPRPPPGTISVFIACWKYYLLSCRRLLSAPGRQLWQWCSRAAPTARHPIVRCAELRVAPWNDGSIENGLNLHGGSGPTLTGRPQHLVHLITWVCSWAIRARAYSSRRTSRSRTQSSSSYTLSASPHGRDSRSRSPISYWWVRSSGPMPERRDGTPDW